MTDRTDACRLEQAAEEYAAKHFLDDAEHLLYDPWPEAREWYKQAFINFGRMILQQLNSEIAKEVEDETRTSKERRKIYQNVIKIFKDYD